MAKLRILLGALEGGGGGGGGKLKCVLFSSYVKWLRAIHRVPQGHNGWHIVDKGRSVERTASHSHDCRSSPASFRSFLPPDLVYRPLQGALHRSFAKGGNVIICRGDILRKLA